MAQTIAELVVQISAENAELKAKMNESVKVSETSFTKIGSAIIAAGATAKLFGGIIEGINFNAAAEQAQVSFEVMTGSAQTAQSVLKELKDFANNTPLEFADIRDATQKLLAMGITADEVIPIIKQLGDVSGGNAEKMDRLATVFGQVSTKGRLMGDDLMQMREIGFDPLNEIAKNTGISMADLTDQMSKGQISVQMVKEAFASATSEGGRFNGMLERQSHTLAGVGSTLNDAFKTFEGAATESLTEPLKGLMLVGTSVLNFLTDLPGPILAATTTFLGLGAAIIAITAAAPLFGVALSASFGPIGLAIAGVVAGLVLIGTLITGAIEHQKNLDAALNKTSKDTIENQKAIIEEEIKRNNDELKRRQFIAKTDRDAAKMQEVAIANLIKENEVFYARIRELNRQDQKEKDSARKAELDKEKAASDDRVKLTVEEQKKRKKAIEDANESLAKMEKDNQEVIADQRGKAALKNAQDEAKAYADARSQELADFQNLAREESNTRAVAKDEAAKNHAAMVAAIEKETQLEIDRRDEVVKTLTDAADLINHVSGVFASMGGEGAKQVAKIGSLASNIIQIIASEGSDAQAWFGAISSAIDLAFSGNQAGADAFNASLDKAVDSLMNGLLPILQLIIELIEPIIPILEIIGGLLEGLKPLLDPLVVIFSAINDFVSGIMSMLNGETTFNEEWTKFTTDVTAFFNGDIGKWIIGILSGGLSTLSTDGGLTDSSGMADNTAESIVDGVAGVLTGGIWTLIDTIGTALGWAGGTDYAHGGVAVVGEQGPELVKLPTGSQVVPNYDINNQMGSGTTVNIYSPIAVDPSEAAVVMRNSMRELAFVGAA